MTEARLYDDVLPALLFIGIFVIPLFAVAWHRSVERAAARRVRRRAGSR